MRGLYISRSWEFVAPYPGDLLLPPPSVAPRAVSIEPVRRLVFLCIVPGRRRRRRRASRAPNEAAIAPPSLRRRRVDRPDKMRVLTAGSAGRHISHNLPY